MHGSRSIDSHAKSHAAHRVALTSPRLLLLVVLALLVSAYALGYLPLPGVRPGIGIYRISARREAPYTRGVESYINFGPKCPRS